MRETISLGAPFKLSDFDPIPSLPRSRISSQATLLPTSFSPQKRSLASRRNEVSLSSFSLFLATPSHLWQPSLHFPRQTSQAPGLTCRVVYVSATFAPSSGPPYPMKFQAFPSLNSALPLLPPCFLIRATQRAAGKNSSLPKIGPSSRPGETLSSGDVRPPPSFLCGDPPKRFFLCRPLRL